MWASTVRSARWRWAPIAAWHGVARLEILREHEHADVGVVVADASGGDLVGVGRWHADVDDGDVGPVMSDVVQQRVGVLDLGDDVDTGPVPMTPPCHGTVATASRSTATF
jgi:hypothetical protein